MCEVINTHTAEALRREEEAFCSSILRASAVRYCLVHLVFPCLDQEGLGVVDFRTDRLFSYTFWLCSLDFIT
jgi:hypothetical protein